MSAANDNSAKSALALLRPVLDDMRSKESSPQWQDTMRSIEAIKAIAKRGPEQKP